MNYQAGFFQIWFLQLHIMKGIKYVNFIEIAKVVMEIQGVENGELMVPVNITLVRHTAFLAADTRLCVLIYTHAHTYMY